MTSRHQIVFASGNAGKAREIRALFGDEVELKLQTDLGIASIAETGTTFESNALLKARHASACSGLPALADDSGLEVDVLHGAPGVHSARYAGESATDEENNNKLLLELDAVQGPARTARFRCVLAYVRSPEDMEPVLAAGSWEGHIALVPAGSGGFGYDPVFIDQSSGLCSAQLTPEQKNQRSHRGKALLRLRELLAEAGF